MFPLHAAALAYSRSIRRIGYIHCVLALDAFTFVVQELLTIRRMGIPESHVDLVGSAISTLVNAVLAVGLLRRSQAARRFAIGWYMILVLVAALVVGWMWRYGVAIDPATWPTHFVSKVMPFVLLVIMFLPSTKRLFVSDAQSVRSTQHGDQARSSPSGVVPPGWPVVTSITCAFLIVVCSNFAVDTADWCYRLVFESSTVP